MKLTGPVLADIYLGKIKTWDDDAIAALNPELKLPAMPIRLIYRADGSGTTFNFVNYLSKMSPEWKEKIGEGTTVRWPSGFGGKGNEGVAAYVKQVKGAIGYVELSYATTNKLAYTAMKNAAGKFVLPSVQSIQAAGASADWSKAVDFSLVITNAPGEGAWPIAATNFIIMAEKPKNRLQTGVVFHSSHVGNGVADDPAVHGQINQEIGRFFAACVALFPGLATCGGRYGVVSVPNKLIGRVLAHGKMDEFATGTEIQKQRQRGHIILF